MSNSWLRVPFFWFALTAAAGAALRGMALLPSWQAHYVPLLHAHSHIALLGWGYSALVLLLVSRFGAERDRRSRFFRVNWALTQLTNLGMFIAFALQGYGLFSIAFSTVHILLSYSFAFWMLRRLRRLRGERKGLSPSEELPVKFARAALYFMAISSIGPWSLAVLSAKQMSESPWYDAALYFYLHCQYNGWFTLGLFALLYSKLAEHRIPLHNRAAKLHYKLYAGSLLPSFLLSLLWMDLPAGWRAAAVVSGLLQAAGIAALFSVWHRVRRELSRAITGWAWIFLRFSLALLGVKTILELGSAVPALKPLVFSTRSVVIGYLHLVLLGFVSFMLLSFLMQRRLRPIRGAKPVSAGCMLLLIGFIWNELLLFGDGLWIWLRPGMLPLGREMLFAASLVMLAGIGVIGVIGTNTAQK